MRSIRLSPGLAVAVVAVALASTGTAVGASLITGKQVRNDSLTGADVKNRSLTPADFRGSVRGSQGPAGQQGPAGPAGAQGPAGTIGQTVEALGPEVASAPGGSGAGTVQSSKAECPAGTVVTGGGFSTGVRDFIGYAAISGNGYFVIAINTNEFDGSSIQASAICGSRGGAALRGRSGTSSAAVRAQERRRLETARAELAG